jgi:hypothetical protein
MKMVTAPMKDFFGFLSTRAAKSKFTDILIFFIKNDDDKQKTVKFLTEKQTCIIFWGSLEAKRLARFVCCHFSSSPKKSIFAFIYSHHGSFIFDSTGKGHPLESQRGHSPFDLHNIGEGKENLMKGKITQPAKFINFSAIKNNFLSENACSDLEHK